MPLPEPQPCMSQGCLFQKVTALGQYWEMAYRTSQAEFSHILKSDESKRWVSLHAQKYWCASFLTRSRFNWVRRGWKGKKWEQRKRLVCAQGMRGDPQPPSVWADLTPALPTPTNVPSSRLQNNLPCDCDKPGPPHHHLARTSHHGTRR